MALYKLLPRTCRFCSRLNPKTNLYLGPLASTPSRTSRYSLNPQSRSCDTYRARTPFSTPLTFFFEWVFEQAARPGFPWSCRFLATRLSSQQLRIYAFAPSIPTSKARQGNPAPNRPRSLPFCAEHPPAHRRSR